MKRVGFVVHAGREEARVASAGLVASLREDEVASRGFEGEPATADESSGAEAFTDGLDLIVSVGGDGTFLRAARLASRPGCPVLGVKVGRMGFLTEVEPEEAAPLILRALDGHAPVEERLAVVAESGNGAFFEPQWGLNEVMLEKRARHRLISLAVSVDGAYVTTFSADGVIVATPTGSTAYSFSARGPIVSPSVRSLIVTPVAAHMVFDRSFVLDASEAVSLHVVGDEPGLLSADGRGGVELAVGTRVRIGAAREPARLVRRDDRQSFLARVREKFDLPGDAETDGDDGVA